MPTNGAIRVATLKGLFPSNVDRTPNLNNDGNVLYILGGKLVLLAEYFDASNCNA